MPRIRSLKPEFFKHPGICELPIAARYFFAGLWCQADREGRIKDRPKVLKVEIAPWDDLDPEKVLSQLHYAGFIQRYEVDGEGYISIRHFAKHQRPHPREAKSEIPPPPKPGSLRAVESNGVSRPAEEVNGEASPAPRTDPAVERNGKVPGILSLGSGSLGSGGSTGGWDLEAPRPCPDFHGSDPVPAAVPESPPPPIASAPEKPDPLATYLTATWQISGEVSANLAKAWRLKWRGLDVLAEVKKARAYEQETGKTHTNSPAGFLRGWLRRTAENQNAASHNGTPAGSGKSSRQRAADSAREADLRDRQFREEQARGTDPRALVHRLWLWQRWPQEFPQYAPPEAEASNA